MPVGPELQGRVVNALGEPIDGQGPIKTKLSSPIEKIALVLLVDSSLISL